jgi:hypothetical protein
MSVMKGKGNGVDGITEVMLALMELQAARTRVSSFDSRSPSHVILTLCLIIPNELAGFSSSQQFRPQINIFILGNLILINFVTIE